MEFLPIVLNTIKNDCDDDEFAVTMLFDSDDELDKEVEAICTVYLNKRPRISVENFFENVVSNYSDEEFIRHLRISRELFDNLSKRYEETEAYQKISNQSLVLSASKTFAIFLWFAGHEGESFRQVSNLFNVSLSTVHRVIIRMTSFISGLSQEAIKWPTLDEMKDEAAFHKELSKIPGVIGAIDGTRIEIIPPRKDRDDYIDRKGNPTLALQGICNRHRKFISIFMGYPGSVHDARLFRCSNVIQKLEACPPGYYLLGDSAYPCLPNLLVPYRDNGKLSKAQKTFNRQLSKSRVQIEHSFGILKQRFRQLYYCKLRGIKTLCHFFRACIVLHNMSKEEELVILNEDGPRNDTYREQPGSGEGPGNSVREAVCQYLAQQLKVK